MIMKLYVIQDKIAEESGPIFEAKNDGVAFRKYQKTINEVGNSDEYALYCVGEIDHENNVIQPILHECTLRRVLEENENE